MEITEVRIKLVERSSERLRAFCSITLDGDFVIRDLKIIDGANGAFVAMPSRKLADRCPRCGSKNHLRAKFCNECGQKLNENRAPKDPQGRAKLHADVAHPINAACRERVQKVVIEAFNAELEKAKSPDYRPPKYDDFEVDLDEEGARSHQARPAPASVQAQPKPAPQPEPEEEAEAEPASVSERSAGDEEFGDYNSLIAELKRDAAGRREKHEEARGNRVAPPAPTPPPPPMKEDRGRRGGGGGRDRRDNRGAPPSENRSDRPAQPREQRPPAPAQSPAPEPAPPPPAPTPAPRREEEDDFSAGL